MLQVLTSDAVLPARMALQQVQQLVLLQHVVKLWVMVDLDGPSVKDAAAFRCGAVVLLHHQHDVLDLRM